MAKRQLVGIVVSDKMQKTVVVNVERIKEHPKYHRRYRISKNYKAHTETPEFKMGDKVLIEESVPKSRDKKWRVIKKISSGNIAPVEEVEEGPEESTL